MSGLRRVRGPVTAAQRRALERLDNPGLHGTVLAAAAAYSPQGAPLSWIVDQTGIDVDVVVAVVWALNRDGRVTQRTAHVGGMDQPYIELHEPVASLPPPPLAVEASNPIETVAVDRRGELPGRT